MRAGKGARLRGMRSVFLGAALIALGLPSAHAQLGGGGLSGVLPVIPPLVPAVELVPHIQVPTTVQVVVPTAPVSVPGISLPALPLLGGGTLTVTIDVPSLPALSVDGLLSPVGAAGEALLNPLLAEDPLRAVVQAVPATRYRTVSACR